MNINLQQAKSLLKNNKVIAYIKQDGVPVYTDVHEFVPFNDATFKTICIDLLNDNNVQLTYSDNISFEELQAINNNDLLDNVILSEDWEDVTSLKDLKFFTGFTTIKNLSDNNEVFKNIVEIDMRNISTIGSYAFLNHTGISLYNTYNITTINQRAFDSAIILNDTLAFNSLTTIGQYAFYNTLFNNIIHLGTVTSIPLHCFENSVFTNITFTGNNISIGNYCFKGATIGHFTQESRIISVGNNAFENIDSEMFVQLSNLMTLGNNAFKGSNISTIISLGNIAAIGEYAFSNCINLTNLDFIPNTVLSIGSHAFDGCINIKKIQLPSSVTSIDSYAISNCTKLRNIKSLGSITAFTSLMVNNCPNLEIVYFPDTIESWNAIAFNNCANLKIFANIKNYQNLDRCFANCPKLDTIWFADTLAEIKVNGIQVCNNQFIKTIKLGKNIDPSTGNNIIDFEITGETVTVDNEELTVYHYPFEQMTLLDTIDANNTTFDALGGINYMAKFNMALNHIPNNIKLLHIFCKQGAPVTAQNVNTISFSAALNNYYSFSYLSMDNHNLHNIIFEDNEDTQYMQYFSYSFIDDTSLNLKIGQYVSDIRYGSWYKHNDTSVKLNIDFSKADNLKNIQYSGLTFSNINDKVYINMPVLPPKLENCNYSAFCGYSTELPLVLSNDLVFPNTIKEISYSSFNGIDFNNHTLTIPPTAEVSIYSLAFCGIKNFKKLNICNYPNHKVKTINYSFTGIGDSSGNIHLDDFYITKNMKLYSSFNTQNPNNNTFTIDNLIFDHDCIYDTQIYTIFNQIPVVTNLYLPDDSRCYKPINCKPINIHNLDGSIHNDATSNQLDLQLLKSITYKENTTHINSIHYCGSLPVLESINIPNTVEYIGATCFLNTPLLKSFDMPDNIQYIGMLAFYNSGIQNINLKNIKWIGHESFMNCNNLREVEIPSSIVNYPNQSDLNYDNRYGSITGAPYNGYEAFMGCAMLKRVILPNNMTTLPYGMFKNCTRLSDINLDNIRILQRESLRSTSVNIDLENTQLTTIGDYALYSATNTFKETLTLSNTITEIGEGGLSTSYTAMNGYKIKTIVLPQNLHKLSKEVFANHQYLNTINLENINYFDVSCLANTNISKLGSNTDYECDLSDTSIKYIGKSFIKNTPLYKNLVKFDISNTKCSDTSLYTLNDICNYPYSTESTNTYAVEIDLSNSNVNCLDTSAFVFKLNTGSLYSKKVKLNWRNLNDYINLGTRSICNAYNNAIDNLIVDIDVLNSSLGDVSLNNSASYCNTKVNFINLSLGEIVYINPSTGFYVTYPDSAVMDNGTYGIETLKFGPSVNNNTYFSTNIFSCCKKLDISESKMTQIRDYRFSGSNYKFEEITIGNKVTSIGTAAFESCPYLKKVDIGTGITSIGFYAFVNDPVEVLICRATTPPTLASGHNNYRLGLYDTNLSKSGAGIYVPDESVEAYKTAWASSLIGPNGTYTADYFIKPLSRLNVPAIDFKDSEVESILLSNYDVNNKGYLTVEDASNIQISSTIFRGNTDITSFNELKHFKATTYIDGYYGNNTSGTFYNCTSLLEIDLSNITHINRGGFNNCTSLTTVNNTDKLTTLYEDAFNHCAFSTINLDHVTTVNNDSLSNNTHLTTLSLPALLTIGTFCKGCTSLVSVTNLGTATSIPGAALHYGGGAFGNCTALTTVVLPSTCRSIGECAFINCTNLTNIDLSNIRTIDNGAFKNCTHLTSINLESITSIEAYAFENNTSLTTVEIDCETVPTGDLYMFYGCSALESIYVPDALVDSFKSANGWSTYASKIKGISEKVSNIDYVQSGLVLHLDGINKGSANSWIDSVSNREFVEHGTLSKDSSSYIFDGTKNINYLTYNIDSSFPEFTQDNCTVEICYKLNEINDNKYFIFGSVPSWSFKPMFFVASNDNITWNQHGHIYTGFSNNGESILYNTEIPITLSINGDRNIVNGNSIGYMTDTIDYWDTNNDNIYHIGSATSGGAYDYPFNGHIYSIRFYNRKLTQAEQLHNQQVDNTRFNLGLTIGE